MRGKQLQLEVEVEHATRRVLFWAGKLERARTRLRGLRARNAKRADTTAWPEEDELKKDGEED